HSQGGEVPPATARCHPAAVAGVPYRPLARLRHRQAAQPRQERDGGIEESLPMTLCVFEDRDVLNLEPLTLTRPALELVCGTGPLLERQKHVFGASDVGAVVRPMLAAAYRPQRPEVAVNDDAWLSQRPRFLVNGRWLPPAERLTDLTTPRAGCVGEDVAY